MLKSEQKCERKKIQIFLVLFRRRNKKLRKKDFAS